MNAQTTKHFVDETGDAAGRLTKEEIRVQIEEIGILPAMRVESVEDALFVAKALASAGIPVVEISANAAGAIDAISHLAKHAPKTIVGAGGITSADGACRCLDAGAKFLTSDALVLEVLEFAAKQNVVVLPGAFTPTEIVAAWNAGADIVKVVPCGAAGGASYIRSVKAALPDVPLMAAGGVNQMTAFEFMAAGAMGLGIGRELLPREAVRLRQTARIQELARRFLSAVDNGRIEAAGRRETL